jgi:hypothetical protein
MVMHSPPLNQSPMLPAIPTATTTSQPPRRPEQTSDLLPVNIASQPPHPPIRLARSQRTPTLPPNNLVLDLTLPPPVPPSSQTSPRPFLPPSLNSPHLQRPDDLPAPPVPDPPPRLDPTNPRTHRRRPHARNLGRSLRSSRQARCVDSWSPSFAPIAKNA